MVDSTVVRVNLPRPTLLGARYAVAAAHPLAASAGASVFERGGNAVDAAVSAAVALAVVAPEACGLGGDALAVLARPGEPSVAYLGGAAVPSGRLPLDGAYGPAAAGVPGAVAAWCELHGDHGMLPLGDALAPAIGLAREGFPVSPGLPAAVARGGLPLRQQLARCPILELQAGTWWRQPELASVLEEVAARGAEGFYRGWVAGAITAASEVSADDLGRYRVSAEEPVQGGYRGVPLTVTGPPSQAALALIALRGLEHAPGPGTVAGEHAAIEMIKAAFRARAKLVIGDGVDALGGAELPPVPATASGASDAGGYEHTAAVTTAGADGTVVSMLVSIFHEFGSRVLVPDGGFLLNNRLAGGGAESLPAGSRAGHTLSPMVMEIAGRRLALATPGADGQVQTLVQLVRLLVDAERDLAEALAAPRWRVVGDELLVEESLGHSLTQGLAELGHAVVVRSDGDLSFGAAAAAGASIDRPGVVAAADPRREVWAAVA